jgi:TPP-dependent pyruvate/acetoin dehydrogenase alpha subunit
VKKSKKGKDTLSQAEALEYVRRRLQKAAKAVKPSTPALITKAARTRSHFYGDSVEAYRRKLDRELWAEQRESDDPANRATAEVIQKSLNYRGPQPQLTPCRPWDSSERDLAWRAEFGFGQ